MGNKRKNYLSRPKVHYMKRKKRQKEGEGAVTDDPSLVKMPLVEGTSEKEPNEDDTLNCCLQNAINEPVINIHSEKKSLLLTNKTEKTYHHNLRRRKKSKIKELIKSLQKKYSDTSAVVPTRRVIEMMFFIKQLQDLDNHNTNGCKFSDMVLRSERRTGLISSLKFICTVCGVCKTVWTDQYKPQGKASLNTDIVRGLLEVQEGFSGLKTVLSSVDLPHLSFHMFTQERINIRKIKQKKELLEKELKEKELKENIKSSEGKENQMEPSNFAAKENQIMSENSGAESISNDCTYENGTSKEAKLKEKVDHHTCANSFILSINKTLDMSQNKSRCGTSLFTMERRKTAKKFSHNSNLRRTDGLQENIDLCENWCDPSLVTMEGDLNRIGFDTLEADNLKLDLFKLACKHKSHSLGSNKTLHNFETKALTRNNKGERTSLLKVHGSEKEAETNRKHTKRTNINENKILHDFKMPTVINSMMKSQKEIKKEKEVENCSSGKNSQKILEPENSLMNHQIEINVISIKKEKEIEDFSSIKKVQENFDADNNKNYEMHLNKEDISKFGLLSVVKQQVIETGQIPVKLEMDFEVEETSPLEENVGLSINNKCLNSDLNQCSNQDELQSLVRFCGASVDEVITNPSKRKNGSSCDTNAKRRPPMKTVSNPYSNSEHFSEESGIAVPTIPQTSNILFSLSALNRRETEKKKSTTIIKKTANGIGRNQMQFLKLSGGAANQNSAGTFSNPKAKNPENLTENKSLIQNSSLLKIKNVFSPIFVSSQSKTNQQNLLLTENKSPLKSTTTLQKTANVLLSTFEANHKKSKQQNLLLTENKSPLPRTITLTKTANALSSVLAVNRDEARTLNSIPTAAENINLNTTIPVEYVQTETEILQNTMYNSMPATNSHGTYRQEMRRSSNILLSVPVKTYVNTINLKQPFNP